MSETLTAVIFDAATGETIERPLTAEEIAELEIMQAEEQARQAEQDAKAAARVSALAKLKELGLSQEEIEAL
jgi:hypothetical protein